MSAPLLLLCIVLKWCACLSVSLELQDDDLDDSQTAMDCLQKSAPGAETVFYNSDMDDDDEEGGMDVAQSIGGGGDGRFMSSYGSRITVGGGGGGALDQGGRWVAGHVGKRDLQNCPDAGSHTSSHGLCVLCACSAAAAGRDAAPAKKGRAWTRSRSSR